MELPQSWLQTNLGDVVDYGKVEKAEPNNISDDTWGLELEDIEKDSSKITQRVSFLARQSKSTKNRFKKGDVLYGKLRPYLNKVIVADSDGVCTTEIIPLSGGKDLNNQYLFFWLKHPIFLAYVSEVGYGVNMPRLGTKDGIAAPFVLAPLAEQQQIAAKLDELLAQVDTLKTRLDAIPKIIKRFRQSVLAAAVSGKLTEDWRSENEYDAVVNIGEKCFEERKLVLKKTKKPIKLEETPKLELPNTWGWVSIDEICLKITDGTHHSPKSYPSGDYMYVTSKNVREGYINLSNISFVDQKTHSEIYSRCDVVKGDVLYVKDGANTGLSCVNNISEEVSLLSSVGVLRPTKLIAAKYLEHYLNSPIGRRLMLDMIGGTAIMRLTLTKIMNSPLSLPPVEEQSEIVHQVEQLLTYADQIEQRVKDAQARVNHLTQAILAKAFRGELTADWREQNPGLITGENSAEALLARIKQERQLLENNKVTNRRTIKKQVKV